MDYKGMDADRMFGSVDVVKGPDNIWVSIDRRGRIAKDPEAHIEPKESVRHAYAHYVRADRIEALEAENARLTAERDRQYDENVARIAAEAQAIARAEHAEAQLTAERANADRLADALGLVLPESCPRCGGDCGSANPPVYVCPMHGHNALAAHTQNRESKSTPVHMEVM